MHVQHTMFNFCLGGKINKFCMLQTTIIIFASNSLHYLLHILSEHLPEKKETLIVNIHS